jgi:hypothetical protein
VRRNEARFPADFSVELTDQEVENLKSQFATSSWMTGAHGGRRKRPRVFTEYGAIMAASILNSPRAVQTSVYVVRAFVKLREALASTTALARRMEAFERSVAALGIARSYCHESPKPTEFGTPGSYWEASAKKIDVSFRSLAICAACCRRSIHRCARTATACRACTTPKSAGRSPRRCSDSSATKLTRLRMSRKKSIARSS